MMRVAKNQRRSKTLPAAQVKNFPAPVKGWNTVDSPAQMDPRFALRLDNWYPRGTYLEIRKGASEWAYGVTGNVESLLPYSPQSGADKLFAAGGANIYDASAGGNVGAAVQAGLTNGKWQSVNYAAASATHYLVAVNGADNMRYYDGAAWTTITGASVPAITGPNTNTFIHVNVFKQRLYFVPINKLSFYYLPATAVGGVATEFVLGSYFKEGGYLMAMATWTIDAGNGIDDLAVFWTSEGEVAVFKGSNPGDPADWELVGVFFIGKPIGRRCFVKFGGDMLALTQTGVFPLSKALLSTTLNREEAMSYFIDPTFRSLYSLYGSTWGWDITVWPAQTMLVVNVPNATEPQQLIFNYETRAWCRFTGWTAYCFCEWQGNLYWGGAGDVRLAWNGLYDSTQSTAAAVVADAKQAFIYVDGRKTTKSFTAARPYLAVDAQLEFLLGLNVDFEDIPPVGVATYTVTGSSLWDSAVWDSSLWGGGQVIQKQWKSPTAKVGQCVAVCLRIGVTQIEVQWASTDFLWTPGGLWG